MTFKLVRRPMKYELLDVALEVNKSKKNHFRIKISFIIMIDNLKRTVYIFGLSPTTVVISKLKIRHNVGLEYIHRL